jgi:hypothetical protein
MVATDDVAEDATPNPIQPIHGVHGAHDCVMRTARWPPGFVAGTGPKVPLPIRLRLAKVVPQTGQKGPVSTAKRSSEIAGPPCRLLKVVFKRLRPPGASR